MDALTSLGSTFFLAVVHSFISLAKSRWVIKRVAYGLLSEVVLFRFPFNLFLG